MSIVGESGKVFDDSIAVRGTCNNTGHIVGFEQFLHDGFVGDTFFFGNHFQIYPMETGVGFDNLDDSGIQCSGNNDFIAFLGMGNRHEHGFGRGRSSVVHGSIAAFHTGQLAYHALKLEYVL